MWGGGAAGGSGCTTRLCTVKPKTSIYIALTITARGGGVVEAIPALGQACNKDTRSYKQARNKDTMSFIQACNNDTRSF